jgi:trans-aconitate methyltransferase
MNHDAMAEWSRYREISDEIVRFDPGTLARLPVEKLSAASAFEALGDHRSVVYVRSLPDAGGLLNEQAVDAALVQAHYEMQRIAEEFEHGQRVTELLRPVLATLRRAGVSPPFRVVDLGCGIGYAVRYLAARGRLGDDVTLLGADFNPALIGEARRLAAREALDCEFAVADAFALPEPGTVYLSTGVLHHFPETALPGFFAGHERPATWAFLHFDFQPSVYLVPGAWLFHVLRTRHPLARHDGVVSARRTWGDRVLTEKARAGAPGFTVGVFGTYLWRTPVRRVFSAVVGVRPEIADAFREGLGRRANAWDAPR